MGLTGSSAGTAALRVDGRADRDAGAKLLALAGNPNVGKSTLFNALTGLRQHTGNWPGKTVGSAYGKTEIGGETWLVADIPGTYSLFARSAEEEAARELLLFGGADVVAVVCDAASLERNLALVLQLRELGGKLILCLNLMDEAKRRGIRVDCRQLSKLLGIPVVGMSAGRGLGLEEFRQALRQYQAAEAAEAAKPDCGEAVAQAAEPLERWFAAHDFGLPAQWLALRVLEGEASMVSCLEKHLGLDFAAGELAERLSRCRENLRALGLEGRDLGDLCALRVGARAKRICSRVLRRQKKNRPGEKLDRMLTHRIWGWPVMLVLLAGILWLTISGANVPSELLSRWLFALTSPLKAGFAALGLGNGAISFLVDGVYKTVAWVVSVMLPPMAVFFPLFTLLEDLGVLPRIAFNLDGAFMRCGACGKQGLTACMGFGCNAAGVVGCRIIDSPRERLIAVLTNSFVPCNGRFPTMIVLIRIFFAGSSSLSGLYAAIGLTGLVCLGLALTFAASKLLTLTVLKGKPSSFTLELPPYRRPKLGEVLVRSVLDRTVFVLLRAMKTAVPAGALIWLLANVSIGGAPALDALRHALDPAAAWIGLDGAILLAFILGLPANEIVLPVLLMCYLSGGSLMDYASAAQLRQVLLDQGWTAVTAACAALFTLLHWPCATTLLTIKKETGSLAYTLLAAALPTAFGLLLCLSVSLFTSLWS